MNKLASRIITGFLLSLSVIGTAQAGLISYDPLTYLRSVADAGGTQSLNNVWQVGYISTNRDNTQNTLNNFELFNGFSSDEAALHASFPAAGSSSFNSNSPLARWAFEDAKNNVQRHGLYLGDEFDSTENFTYTHVAATGNEVTPTLAANAIGMYSLRERTQNLVLRFTVQEAGTYTINAEFLSINDNAKLVSIRTSKGVVNLETTETINDVNKDAKEQTVISGTTTAFTLNKNIFEFEAGDTVDYMLNNQSSFSDDETQLFASIDAVVADVEEVPEPSTFVMMFSALLFFGSRRLKKAKS